MKTIKTLLIATILVVVTSVNAHAIGKTEKGVLIGMGSMLLLPSLFENAGKLFGSTSYTQRRSSDATYYEPPKQRVVYKTRVIEREPTIIYRTEVVEKVYYEPRRKYNARKHHRKIDRKHRNHHPRYAYRH